MAQEDRDPRTENTEIEPIADESLEEVAGGGCSWSICSSSNNQS